MRTSVSPEVTTRLRLAVTRLNRRLRQQALDDVTPTQLSALSTIEHHGPITLGDLAAHERVQPPTMTRIVAALEELALVHRDVDAADRRIARVSITAEGQRLLDRTRTRKNAFLAVQLGRLTADELAVMEQAIPLLERLVEERRT